MSSLTNRTIKMPLNPQGKPQDQLALIWYHAKQASLNQENSSQSTQELQLPFPMDQLEKSKYAAVPHSLDYQSKLEPSTQTTEETSRCFCKTTRSKNFPML